MAGILSKTEPVTSQIKGNSDKRSTAIVVMFSSQLQVSPSSTAFLEESQLV